VWCCDAQLGYLVGIACLIQRESDVMIYNVMLSVFNSVHPTVSFSYYCFVNCCDCALLCRLASSCSWQCMGPSALGSPQMVPDPTRSVCQSVLGWSFLFWSMPFLWLWLSIYLFLYFYFNIYVTAWMFGCTTLYQIGNLVKLLSLFASFLKYPSFQIRFLLTQFLFFLGA